MDNKFDSQQIFSFAVSLIFWWFILHSVQAAVGVVALIFVHELGHVIAAKIRGISFTMPSFTPFGAYVMTSPSSITDEAYTKLGGPIVGGLASLAVLGLGWVFASPVMVQVGTVSVFLNLFNLIPLDPFDGGGIAQVFGRWTVVPGVVAFIYFFLVLTSGNPINMLFAGMIGFQAYQAYQQRIYHRQSRPSYFVSTTGTKAGVALLYVGTLLVLGYVLLVPAIVPFLLNVHL